jgi:hypothetical protein
MGGISLLNLADRTVSYTNSFKLPRTPTNEQIFEFASQPTRNNRPNIEVTIKKGLFQKEATLKVKEFDGDYKCEVAYKSQLDLIKGKTYETLLGDRFLTSQDTNTNFLNELVSGLNLNGFRYLVTNSSVVPSISNSGGNCSVGYLLSELFIDLNTAYGIDLSNSDILLDPEFQKSYIIIPNLWIEKVDIVASDYWNYYTRVVDSGLLVTELLKTIAQLFFCNVVFGEKNTNINKIQITSSEGINIETLSFSKTIYNNESEKNFILYNCSKLIPNKYESSDMFTIGGGVGNKDLLTLTAYLPDTVFVSGNPRLNITNSDVVGKMIIAVSTSGTGSFILTYETTTETYVTGSNSNAGILSLSGFYSSILNPIFKDPVILNADGYIDPLTDDAIMNERVINSVKLGGRYWVDEKKYNLTAGKSVLKLIKL